MSNEKLTEVKKKIIQSFVEANIPPEEAIFCVLSIFVTGCVACKIDQEDAVDLLRETYNQMKMLVEKKSKK